jgi:hypothetical protein
MAEEEKGGMEGRREERRKEGRKNLFSHISFQWV